MAAIYTIELCELIQYYAPSDAPLIDPDVIYNAGAKFVPMDAVNMLNSAHRKAFLEGFLLHYFNFEIAYPTLAAWQIAFFDKLYNNHEYIDQVMDKLDRQIWSEYSKRTTDNKSTHERETSGTRSDETSETTTGTTNNTRTDDLTDDTTYNTETSSSGTDTDTISRGGDDNVTENGTIGNTASGTDTRTTSGNSKDTGIVTTEHKKDEKSTVQRSTSGSNDTTTDANALQFQFNTPQGSLENMRTPKSGSHMAGSGVSYAENTTYNYMTAAGENDSTTVNSETNTAEENSTTTDTGTGNDKETRDLTQTNSGTDSTQYGRKDDQERNITTRTEYGSTEDRSTKYGKTDAHTGTDTAKHTGTVTDAGTTDTTRTGTATGSENGTENGTDETHGTDEYERITRADIMMIIPMMGMIWDLFNDLFLQVW